MSSKQLSSNEVSVDEQSFERYVGETEDESSNLRPTVEQEKQAKVDANHPDGAAVGSERIYGQTLAQEERIRGREEELERISAQAELGTQDGRAERTRQAVAEQRRVKIRLDPREKLSRDELAMVNREARRVAEKIHGGYTPAAIARQLAERVVSGVDVPEAVFGLMDDLKTAPGTIVPIDDLGAVPSNEVSLEGEIVTLWTPSDSSIQQVGLVADDTGIIKFTTWVKSRQPLVREGERVRFRHVKKNWYQGRLSVALTSESLVAFPERGRWWEE
jgi:hypothetical protein